MSPTERQRQRERDSIRAFGLQKLSLAVALIAVLISGGSFWWQVHSARDQKRTYGEQMEAIKASVRLLTATVAPQLLKAVDDSLVSALTLDPAAASTALNKAANDTQQLRRLGAKLPLSEVSATASQMNTAIAKHSDLLATWQATAEVVSYRSELHTPDQDLPNCLDSHSAKTTNLSVLYFHDCSLDLGAVDYFEPFVVKMTQKQEDGKVASGYIKMFLTMSRVVVRYDGGPLISITGFQCADCAFVLGRPSAIPPTNGRVVAQTLLTANLDRTLIAFPNA